MVTWLLLSWLHIPKQQAGIKPTRLFPLKRDVEDVNLQELAKVEGVQRSFDAVDLVRVVPGHGAKPIPQSMRATMPWPRDAAPQPQHLDPEAPLGHKLMHVTSTMLWGLSLL